MQYAYIGPAFRIVDGVTYPFAISDEGDVVWHYKQTNANSKAKALNNIRYQLAKSYGVKLNVIILKEEYLHIV